MQGQLALVTGGASGMGKAVAKALLAQEAHVILADVSAAKLNETATELKASGQVQPLELDLTVCDLNDKLDAALNGRQLDIVVHCAGISPTMGSAARIMDVNLGASVRLMEAMQTRTAADARVVLIASNSGHMVGTVIDDDINEALGKGDVSGLLAFTGEGDFQTNLSYAISKRGVILLARREAVRLADRGVRVNSLSPGIVATPLGEQEMAVQAGMPIMIEKSPLKRMGRPEEIAQVVDFLIGPAASFVTGSDVLVDGGEMTAGFAMPIPGHSASLETGFA